MGTEFTRMLEAAKSGRADAVATIYDRYGGAVMAVVRRRLRGGVRRRYDTMDLAHSVFAEVLRDLPRVKDLGEDAFRHWLYIKAENKVRAKLRRHFDRHGARRETSLGTRDKTAGSSASPLAQAAGAEETTLVRDALASLDKTSRSIVELRHGQGKSFREIAQELGLPSEDAARKRYARCLTRLRDRWPAPR